MIIPTQYHYLYPYIGLSLLRFILTSVYSHYRFILASVYSSVYSYFGLFLHRF